MSTPVEPSAARDDAALGRDTHAIEVDARLIEAANGLPERRPCTRCDGTQVNGTKLGGAQESGALSPDASYGFALFVCDTCEMIVGVDMAADPTEFLLHRGAARHYTKDTFGTELLGHERRIETVDA